MNFPNPDRADGRDEIRLIPLSAREAKWLSALHFGARIADRYEDGITEKEARASAKGWSVPITKLLAAFPTQRGGG